MTHAVGPPFIGRAEKLAGRHKTEPEKIGVIRAEDHRVVQVILKVRPHAWLVQQGSRGAVKLQSGYLTSYALIMLVGLVGAVIAVSLRGLENDVYLQIGLLTTMGLASKNAILMIEFAEQEERKGKRVIEAAISAARIRLRPILMTTGAMVLGSLPLAIASGAGAESRQQIGLVIVGGLLVGTFFTLFVIPTLYLLLRRWRPIRKEAPEAVAA